MHRSETEETVPCTACGTPVGGSERTYSFGDDGILCFACAVAREGAYDERLDRWTTAPRIDDLTGENDA